MAPGFLKNLVITVLYPNEDLKGECTPQNIKRWISKAKGEQEAKVTDRTTHLVLSKRQWRQQGGEVKKALASESLGKRKAIKIVTTEWLVETLHEQRKIKDKDYLWQKVDGKRARLTKPVAREETEIIRGQGPASSMADVFTESTEPYVSEKEKKDTAQQIQDAQEQEQALVNEKNRKREALKAAFTEGVKKARNDFFTDDYHIYDDGTGFKYEIMLTKVDMKTNTNQRIALTIYESNQTPHIYAVNSQFAATKLHPQNTILAATGCPYPTAFRVFKNGFKHLTQVDWDDRVTVAKARRKNRQQPEQEDRPFIYTPPRIGPLGRLPEGEYKPVEAEIDDSNLRALLAEQDDMQRQAREAIPVIKPTTYETPFSNEVVNGLNDTYTQPKYSPFENMGCDSQAGPAAAPEPFSEMLQSSTSAAELYNPECDLNNEMQWLLDDAEERADHSSATDGYDNGEFQWSGHMDSTTTDITTAKPLDNEDANDGEVPSASIAMDSMDVQPTQYDGLQEEVSGKKIEEAQQDTVMSDCTELNVSPNPRDGVPGMDEQGELQDNTMDEVVREVFEV